ncbi:MULTISPECIES: daptide-type RiPP [unclassified Streptomyces]|uniref:daptide-type RiPP n=1 Tax=unclassified Streptomyces TaxID=2593676 RepID=UPI001660B953|nr:MULTISPECIES: daptide-type RiPP [unclassified Streptomyces]
MQETQEKNEFGSMLELGMQELEAMEAPGFWTGFSIGVGIVSVATASAAVSIAVT